MSNADDMKVLVDKTEPYTGQRTKVTLSAEIDGEEAIRYEGRAALFAIKNGEGTISGISGKLSTASIGAFLLATAKAAAEAANQANGIAGRVLIAITMKAWADGVLSEGKAKPGEPDSSDR